MSAKTLRNLLIALGILIVGAVAAGALVKLGKKPERQAPPASRPVVSAFTVAPDTEPIRVKSFGSVKAKRSISIVPRVSGEVVEKSPHFEAGGYFTEDQMLLKIDDTDYILAVQQARANVAKSEYNLALAEEEAQVALQEWERIGSDGMDSGSTAEPTALVMHEPQLKLARANLQSAKAALDQAELNLDRCTITAPFDGRMDDMVEDMIGSGGDGEKLRRLAPQLIIERTGIGAVGSEGAKVSVRGREGGVEGAFSGTTSAAYRSSSSRIRVMFSSAWYRVANFR